MSRKVLSEPGKCLGKTAYYFMVVFQAQKSIDSPLRLLAFVTEGRTEEPVFGTALTEKAKHLLS